MSLEDVWELLKDEEGESKVELEAGSRVDESTPTRMMSLKEDVTALRKACARLLAVWTKNYFKELEYEYG